MAHSAIYLQAALSHFLIKRDNKSNTLSAGLASKLNTPDYFFPKKKKEVPYTVKVEESGRDVLFSIPGAQRKVKCQQVQA